MTVKSQDARLFYETETLRGGWSVRQLDRQIASQFYERTTLSKSKAALFRNSKGTQPWGHSSADDEVKDPMILEFLGLKDEYSESALEEALVLRLEQFLLELGNDFAFIARQRRLRVGNEWYRIDLLFFHRRLRCLAIIDLKIGKFSHADAGQMNLYLNYAREHWTLESENPPIGLILSSEKNEAVAQWQHHRDEPCAVATVADVSPSPLRAFFPRHHEIGPEVHRPPRHIAVQRTLRCRPRRWLYPHHSSRRACR
jgi:predicted nuclease of restriction endonuclease-like (RecB) superfamily